MSKRLLVAICLLVGVESAMAQETYTFANEDRALQDGKELFDQNKHAISQRYIDRYIEESEGKRGGKKLTLADGERMQEAHFLQAANAYALQRENAASLLRQYLIRFPYSKSVDECHFMLGNIAFKNKQYNLALKEFNQTKTTRIEKEHRDEMTFNRGYCYLRLDDLKSAKSEFARLKSKSGSRYNKSALYYYSYCQYAEGNYDDALVGFEKVMNEPGLRDIVPYYMVQIYYKQKDYERLMPFCEELIEKQQGNPNNAEVHRILGECKFHESDYQATIKHLTAYEKMSPKVVRGDMYMLGIAYLKQGEEKNAIQRLTKVTTEEDSLAQNAFLHLGHAYMTLGEKNNARMAYSKAARIDADTKLKEEAAYNYALATYETTTPFAESITAFETFLNDYPKSKYKNEINERLVNIYLTTKDYNAAAASLERLTELSPKMRDAKAYILFQLGTEKFVMGEYDNAINAFNESLNTGTDDINKAQAIYWRAESKYRQGKWDEARADYQRFLKTAGAEKDKDYHLVNYNIGYTYFEQRQFEDATTYFLRYVNNEKDTRSESYSDGLNRLADCYFMRRDLDNAEKYYGRAFDTKGENSDYAAFQGAYIKGLKKDYSGKINGMRELLSRYATSSYNDDAYYEMGRAQVLAGETDNAIETYKALIAKYPSSPFASKAALEIGMAYSNEGNNAKAIEAYKDVVSRFPNSIETQTALESLESIYVEENNVSDYFAYTRTLGAGIAQVENSREDSLTFLAAERLYMKGDSTAATQALENYLKNFCQGKESTNCLFAQYYLADCLYTRAEKEEAYALYKTLAEKKGNPWMESVVVREAQLAFDLQKYEEALDAFKRLKGMAQEQKNREAARIGVLRCSYLTDDNASTINIGNEILGSERLTEELERETRYYLAKALIENGEKKEALPHLRKIGANTRTEQGAEARYMIADYYFNAGDDKQAEEEITNFIKEGTPHQYWLARAFVLLADISLKQGDTFQAKQYLNSLQANYKAEDSIQDLISERMDIINQSERESIEKTIEQDKGNTDATAATDENDNKETTEK